MEKTFDTLLEDLIQATYETGYYAGKGDSGRLLHRMAITRRTEAKEALIAHVAKLVTEQVKMAMPHDHELPF